MRRALLCAVLALSLAGCTAAQSDPTAGQGWVAGNGTAAVFPPDQREAAPDIAGPTVDGGTLALAELEGPVVINFWASWCGPCVTEAPALANVARAYDGQVAFAGVNVKDQPVNARNFETSFDVPYPSWSDGPGAIAAAFGGIGPEALPSTLILDAQQRVAVRMFGAVDEAQLASHLDRLLAETR